MTLPSGGSRAVSGVVPSSDQAVTSVVPGSPHAHGGGEPSAAHSSFPLEGGSAGPVAGGSVCPWSPASLWDDQAVGKKSINKHHLVLELCKSLICVV